MYRLEIEIAGLPKTTNGSHGHWRAAASERKLWRNAVKLRASSKRPNSPLLKARLYLTRFSSGKTDYDNLVISFKSCVDGLKDARVISDDKDSVVIERHYLTEFASPKKGKVRIVVEEIEGNK